jgi:chromosome segregation ATPase
MVNEIFLVAAVNIRRTYIRITSNIDSYKGRVEETVKKLDVTLKKIEQIRTDLNKKDAVDSKNVLGEMMVFLAEIEEEGKSLERYVDPLNKEIERLALEEQELFRQICQKHPDLTEEKIVECVRQRLIKENL